MKTFAVLLVNPLRKGNSDDKASQFLIAYLNLKYFLISVFGDEIPISCGSSHWYDGNRGFTGNNGNQITPPIYIEKLHSTQRQEYIRVIL